MKIDTLASKTFSTERKNSRRSTSRQSEGNYQQIELDRGWELFQNE